MKHVILVSKLMACCIVVAGLQGRAHAQTQTQTQTQGAGSARAATSPKWIVRCSNSADVAKLACRLSQSLVNGRSRARVLSVSVLPRDGGDAMRIGLPHGTDLRRGVSLTIDRGAAKQIDIVSADTNGSYADLDIDREMMASLKAGRTMKVAFASRTGRPIALDIDLAGFSSAYDLIPR